MTSPGAVSLTYGGPKVLSAGPGMEEMLLLPVDSLSTY